MKSLSIIALGAALSVAALGSAQKPVDHAQILKVSPAPLRLAGSNNWGMREESGLVEKLHLHGDQAIQVRSLVSRTEKKLAGSGVDYPNIVTGGREFHLELAHILTHAQDADYAELWRDSFRRHPEWLAWKTQVIMRNLPYLHLTPAQNTKISKLTADYKNQVDTALAFRSDAGQTRAHFAAAFDAAGNNFDQALMADLTDKQKGRLLPAIQKASDTRSSEEKFRDAWVHSL